MTERLRASCVRVRIRVRVIGIRKLENSDSFVVIKAKVLFRRDFESMGRGKWKRVCSLSNVSSTRSKGGNLDADGGGDWMIRFTSDVFE